SRYAIARTCAPRVRSQRRSVAYERTATAARVRCAHFSTGMREADLGKPLTRNAVTSFFPLRNREGASIASYRPPAVTSARPAIRPLTAIATVATLAPVTVPVAVVHGTESELGST